jgi:hypothetical protein
MRSEMYLLIICLIAIAPIYLMGIYIVGRVLIRELRRF